MRLPCYALLTVMLATVPVGLTEGLSRPSIGAEIQAATITGSLSADSPTLQDGSYYRTHEFKGHPSAQDKNLQKGSRKGFHENYHIL